MSATENAQQKKARQCYWCGIRIHFDKQHLTKNGRYLPILDSGKVHNCRERKRIVQHNMLGKTVRKITKYTNKQSW